MPLDSALSTQHSALSYQEALDFWFGRINYEQRAPKLSDLKLDRMRTLLKLLGNPEQRFRIIHVAGSKGKGSISAMLESILRQAGYRTGLFTSPHLSQVEERIKIDGMPIRPEQLASLMTDIVGVVRLWGGGVVESPPDGIVRGTTGNGLASHYALTTSPPHDLSSLTFFELATAMGFLHFARRRVDLAVVEVGLGGRFDSTNVCLPMVSVISSISFDHTQLLGDRLASIAMEKAGIIKPGRPTASGVTVAEARSVIEDTCRRRRSPLRQLGKNFHYEYEPGIVRNQESGVRNQESGVRNQESGVRSQESGVRSQESGVRDQELEVRTQGFGAAQHSALGTQHLLRPSRVRVITRRRAWPFMELGLLGEHQAANAAVVVACVEQLREGGLHIGDDAVRAGLACVQWPARMEVLGCRPLVVLDCAHNVASAHALVETLLNSFPTLNTNLKSDGSALITHYSPLTPHHSPNSTSGKRVLIFAGSSDKDLVGMFRVLAPHFAHAFLTRFGNSPRGVPSEQLADMLRSVSSLPYTLCPSPIDAWRAAQSIADTDDLICTTGSVFLAGELRPMLVQGRN